MNSNNIIDKIKVNALENKIPIMKDEGISFIINYIKQNNVKNILEIGSAVGYSAIEMALANTDVNVVTIERDEKRYREAVHNIAAANLKTRINLIYGDALEVDIPDKFDLIFIDAAKAQYKKFFIKYSQNLATNGVIIIDNLKFHGFVENPELTHNRNTKQLVRKIRDFTTWLKENKEYSTEFLDIGDGVAISRKII